MQVQESFYRGNPLKSEARTLPWQTYNLAYTLFKKSGEASLFVPIRNMQYLAVLDAEEFRRWHRRESHRHCLAGL